MNYLDVIDSEYRPSELDEGYKELIEAYARRSIEHPDYPPVPPVALQYAYQTYQEALGIVQEAHTQLEQLGRELESLTQKMQEADIRLQRSQQQIEALRNGVFDGVEHAYAQPQEMEERLTSTLGFDGRHAYNEMLQDSQARMAEFRNEAASMAAGMDSAMKQAQAMASEQQAAMHAVQGRVDRNEPGARFLLEAMRQSHDMADESLRAVSESMQQSMSESRNLEEFVSTELAAQHDIHRPMG